MHVLYRNKLYTTTGETLCVNDTTDCYLRLDPLDGSEPLQLVPVTSCSTAQPVSAGGATAYIVLP